MREDALAGLAVIERPPTDVSADRSANYEGARIAIIRPIPQHSQFVADLHHCWPDIVKELYFNNRFESSQRHADGSADDVGFGQWRVEHALAPVLTLETECSFKDSPFALDGRQDLCSTAVSDILSKCYQFRIVAEFVFERAIDGRHHRDRVSFGQGGDIEAVRGWVYTG